MWITEVSSKCIIKEAGFCMFYDEKIILHTKDRNTENSLLCTLSIMKNYGIIFWGSSKTTCNVLSIWKVRIKTMLGLSPRSSCRRWFKKSDILTVKRVHIFEWTMFVIRIPDNFQTNSSIHSTQARQKTKYI